MLSLEMLDVAIGMIFIFLFLSLICTAAKELLESALKVRAKTLETGIRELLNDPNATGLAKDFWGHQLIYSLFKGNYNAEGSKKNLPSYIPSKNFALALLDIVQKQSNVQGQNVSTPQPNTNPLLPLQNAVDKIGNSQVKDALLAIIDTAEGDIAKVQKGIEDWFDSSMDRISGWYKRHSQTWVLVIGFILVLALNVDSIAVFNNLANDRPLRNAIVAQAQTSRDAKTDTTTVPFDRLQSNTNALLKMGLPIGWDKTKNPSVIPDSVGNFLLKLLGWLITGLAISLGAPFWFDTLNKIMVVRATVKPKEKSPEEGSEDRQ
jgi:hypothetical protein